MGLRELTDSGERSQSLLPRLDTAEWAVFGLIAIFLSFANVYTTLLTGIGFGGSLIAALTSALVLRLLRGRIPGLYRLNLGQTIASAGGSMGTAVAAYAAVLLAFPEHTMSVPMSIALFASLGILGVLIGSAARRYMVRYFFPSGTACAVIQKTITTSPTQSDTSAALDARRPLRILAICGSLSALACIPTKIAFERGGPALLGVLNLRPNLQLSLDPVLYGTGIIMGPRIGIGLLLGSLSLPLLVEPAFMAAEGMTAETFDPARLQEWSYWIAISLAALPTLASIGFMYLFHAPPSLPPGLNPSGIAHKVPRQRNRLYVVLAGICSLAGVLCLQAIFGLPTWVALLAIALTLPLCLVNGRITADTDINPLLLLAVAVLALCAFMIPGQMLPLLGLVIIGTTIAGMAIDMMQDHRTGFLLDANPTHQISVQLIGVTLAAICTVPFFAVLDATIGIGDNAGLSAPGPRLYLVAAEGFLGAFPLQGPLSNVILAISIGGIGYAALANWKPARPWMPSLFGIAIGLLLPLSMTLAIALGSLVPVVLSLIYPFGRDERDERDKRRQQARSDSMFVGASMLGVAAVASSLLALLAALLQFLGLAWFFSA